VNDNPLLPNRYFDTYFKTDTVKLTPGQYYVTDEDVAIVTVLGSCIAACIRDVTSGKGGMNHFMLPAIRSQDGVKIGHTLGMRYGSYAMELVINELIKHGCRRENLEAKVFGGAAVVKAFTQLNIGVDNAVFVREYLKVEKIRLASEDLLGDVPRKIYFFPRTGVVHVKYLRTVTNDTVSARDVEYMEKLSRQTIYGDVDMFS